jgi:tetratricopeptide (TPR) repeat protein
VSVKIGLIMKCFICFIAMLFVLLADAQSSFFELKLKLLSDQIQSGFTVDLESPKEQKKMKTNSKGILVLNSVSYNEVYNLILSKDNFVTKIIKIDAKKGYYGEEVTNDVIELEIEMIESLLYVDYDIVTNSPVGLIEIASETGRLENNAFFATNRKNDIDNFLKTAENLSKEIQSQFKKLLKGAKNEIEGNKFELAQSFLQKAEKIVINEETMALRQLLVVAMLREGDEIDAIKKIITVADKLLIQESYNESIALYKRVIRLDPKNNYAQEKINEINVLLVNMEQENNELVIVKTSKSEILARAKIMQENRIDNNYNR